MRGFLTYVRKVSALWLRSWQVMFRRLSSVSIPSGVAFGACASCQACRSPTFSPARRARIMLSTTAYRTAWASFRRMSATRLQIVSIRSKRREEEIPKPAATPALPPAGTRKETEAMSSTSPSTPLKPPEAEPSRSGVATIAEAVKVKGQIFSLEDLYVDGEVEGTVELLENKL